MELLTILRDYLLGALVVLAAWIVVLAVAVLVSRALGTATTRPGLEPVDGWGGTDPGARVGGRS